MSTPGHGTKLYYGVAGGEASTELLEIVEITPPETERADIDRTHLQSVARAFLAGLSDYGEMEFTCRLSGAQTDTLYGLDDGVNRAWKVETVDGDTLEFEGYIKGIGWGGVSTDDLITNTVTVKADGETEMVFTAGGT